MRFQIPFYAVALAAAVPAVLPAQNAMQPITVLQVTRETVKPGKEAAHNAHEVGWARAAAAAKTPLRYIAMTPITGPNEVWYLQGYPSWADYGKVLTTVAESPTLSGIDEKYRTGDNEYLSDSRGMVLRLRPELGYEGRPSDLPHMRYMSVTRISVRAGHTAEYEEARRLIKAAHESAHLSDRYGIWEASSGAPAGTFYLLVSRKTLAELDSGATIHGPAYIAALGGDSGQKKLAMLQANAVISSQTDVFEFAPAQSVAPEAWVEANPGFWKPKAAAMPAKKPAAKKP